MHAIYNPVSTYTPLEREAADAHRERQRRIAARAVEDTPIVLRAPRVVEVVPVPNLPEESWEERQRRLYPKLKRPWFTVLDDGVPLERERLSLEKIRQVVARHYGATDVDLLSARRTANIVLPRQIAMYLAKRVTLRSLPEIGRRFGGRDHTTVLHAVRKIGELIRNDASFAAKVEAITAELGA